MARMLVLPPALIEETEWQSFLPFSGRGKRKNEMNIRMKEKYVVISGTNRKDSNTHKISLYYQHVLAERNIDSELLSLEHLDLSARTPEYEEMEKRSLIPAQKFIIISPEYNGSIPGVLKTLLDLSDYKKVWWGKKALLTGVSSGRSGNVRGMEHLTTILNYLKVVVHPNKLPISSIYSLISVDSSIGDNETRRVINMQIEEFITF